MNIKDIHAAMAEAERFLRTAHSLVKVTKESRTEYGTFANFPPKESGAAKRASMDLTRALAAMRKRG